jgi:glycosyltransferase involved in cell wall biosynthesis
VKAAILFDHFGPYHLARLRAASQVCTLLAIQVRRRSLDYPWNPEPLPGSLRCHTLQESPDHPGSRGLVARLNTALSRLGPDCVFIPGWSSRASLAALHWSMHNRVPAVIMSESTQSDSPRSRWKEWVKSLLVTQCAAALVGGAPHAEYLVRLGMPPERTFVGYDVVDNDYFSRQASEIRGRGAEFRKQFALPDHYFFASARFIKSKNLAWLIDAYALYRAAWSSLHGSSKPTLAGPWSLLVLGDGVERPHLEKRVAHLGLQRCVLLPGFKQYAELPVYYALAGAFVHSSTAEPWGLVVNEAMASGLPVLVSEPCGCRRDLVRTGVNGFSFDPADSEQLISLLLRLSSSEPARQSLGCASRQRICAWGPDRFRQGFQNAASLAIARGPSRQTRTQSLLLQCLLRR